MWATGSEATGQGPAGTAGFTLIELLVVMTIMTLALALVPPMLSGGRSSQSLKIDVRQMVSSLQLARAQAILQNRPVALSIDMARRQITVAGTSETARLHDTTNLAFAAGEEGSRMAGANTFLFYPGGGSSGGDVTLSSDRQRYRIVVDWLTGDVRTERDP